MIAGLPIGAWVLLVVAVGVGLVLQVLFFRAQRRRGGRE
jgi:hypothetical protein